MILISLLQHALGTDYGLRDAPGFLATADFMTQSTEPTGRPFNYAHARDKVGAAPVLHWFAARRGQRGIAAPEQTWSRPLSVIEVEGGCSSPAFTVVSRCPATFTATTRDGNLTPRNSDITSPSGTPTARSTPLLTLVAPERQRDLLRSRLDIYDHTGWLPDAWFSGNAGRIQGGNNALVLFADAFAKRLPGVDFCPGLRRDAEGRRNTPAAVPQPRPASARKRTASKSTHFRPGRSGRAAAPLMDGTTVPPPTRRRFRVPYLRWAIGLMLLTAAVLNSVDRVILSILAPTIQADLHLTDRDYGEVVNLFLVAYAIGHLVTGRIVSTLGTRLGLGIYVAWWSLVNLLTGFAHRMGSLGAFRFLLGLGEAGANTTLTRGVSEWFPPRERDIAIGMYSVGGAISGTITPIIAVGIASRHGWQAVFTVTGAFGLAGAGAATSRRRVLAQCAALVPLMPGQWSVYGVSMILPFAEAAWLTNITAYMVDLIPGQVLGTAIGLVGICSSFGGIAMSQAVPWAIVHISYAPCFHAMVVVHPLALFLLYRFTRNRLQLPA